MNGEIQERRRSPRVPMDGKYELRSGRRVRVRLLDISAGGALVATDERLPVGTTGQLHLLLGATPFEGLVEVKREEPASDGRGRVAGVSIVSVQVQHQDALDDFLRRAGA
jgi:c-di-GMP-binding flagellar brake protein YcgR